MTYYNRLYVNSKYSQFYSSLYNKNFKTNNFSYFEN